MTRRRHPQCMRSALGRLPAPAGTFPPALADAATRAAYIGFGTGCLVGGRTDGRKRCCVSWMRIVEVIESGVDVVVCVSGDHCEREGFSNRMNIIPLNIL